MKEYIGLADRTSSPVDSAVIRLDEKGKIIDLHGFNESARSLAYKVDQFKKAIFYGKDYPFRNAPGVPEDRITNARNSLKLHNRVELLHAAIGMFTESVEFLNEVCDSCFEGRPLDEVNLCEEGGDQLWYMAKAFKHLDTTFEVEMTRNIEKLKARYPEKFTEESALNRDLDTERKILEGRDDAQWMRDHISIAKDEIPHGDFSHSWSKYNLVIQKENPENGDKAFIGVQCDYCKEISGLPEDPNVTEAMWVALWNALHETQIEKPIDIEGAGL